MAGSDEKRKRLRLPRKAVLAASGGFFLLLTASAAAAYFMGAADLISGGGVKVYGVECHLVDTVAFDDGDGEKWVREYISVGESDGPARLRTALRVARTAAGETKADLVLVVVTDVKGPKNRALIRDEAVGARVLYVPHPARVAEADVPFAASYAEGQANSAGDFYGDARNVPLAAIEPMAAAMKSPFGCVKPEKAAAEASAEKPKKKAKAHE